MSVRSVKVGSISLRATEQDLRDFFSFSGDIEHLQILRDNGNFQTAFITFKDPQGAETATLLTGARIVDELITVELAPQYEPPPSTLTVSTMPATMPMPTPTPTDTAPPQKAEDMMSNMLARGFTLGKDALNKAKAFDEKHQLTSTAHQLTSTASAKVASLDQKIGLSSKINAGTSMMNEKVKEVDERFQVSEKTKSIMKHRYILTSTAWMAGAYKRVTKAAGEVGQKAQDTGKGEKAQEPQKAHDKVPDQQERGEKH